MVEFPADTIKKYADALEKKSIAKNELKRRLLSVDKFLRWAHEKGYLADNSFKQMSEAIASKSGVAAVSEESKKQTSRPQFSFESLSMRHYIGFAVVLLLISMIGAGLYNQFFKKTATPFAYSASPVAGTRIISFQGRLTDSIGNPITAPIDITYNFYTAPTGGSPITSSTRVCTAKPDQDGIFSNLIGNDGGPNCSTQLPSAIFTDNPTVYLGVTIGSEPSEMSPRQQIANVGYAINAESLQGMPPGTSTSSIPFISAAGDMLIAAANPGIRSTYSSANFVISSAKTTTIQSANGGDIVLSATDGGTLRFNTYNGTITERMTITPLGNVGISNTNPRASLDVIGSASLSGSLAFNGATTQLTQLNGGDFSFATSPGGDIGAATKMTLTNVGNLGIGTTVPGYRLEVAGSASASGNLSMGGQLQVGRFAANPTAIGAGSVYYNTLTNSLYVYNNTDWVPVGTGTGTGESFWDRALDGVLVPKIPQDALNLGASATASATVHLAGKPNDNSFINTGNVGIGTTTPTAGYKLDIIGSAQMSNLSLSNPGVGNDSRITFQKTNDHAWISVKETVADATTYGFYMDDNPDQVADQFVWQMNDYQGLGSAWQPLNFAGLNATIRAANVNAYGDYNVYGPWYSGVDGVQNNVYQLKTGTLSITPNVSAFSGTTRTYWLRIDGVGTPNTFTWGIGPIGSNIQATGVAITGSAQALDTGVTVTFNATTGGVVNDTYQFRANKGGHVLASNGSVTNPTFSFTSDPNTGMYRSGTDTLAFTTAGSARLTIAANGNIGIGSATPTSFGLEVAGNIGPDADNTRDIGSSARHYNTIYANNIVGVSALGYWARTAGVLSPGTPNDAVAATSSATTVATFTSTGTNTALRAGGNTAYATVDPSGNLTFTNSSAATITGPTAGLTIDATTGTLGFGTSNNNRTINIGTGTGVDTIHIGDGGTGADVITIGSANAGNVTVRSNGILSLTGSTNSIIDFPSFDVATTGQTTIAYANSAALNLSGNAAGITFSGAAANTNTINTSNNNHLNILTGTGNVGIGSATPGTKLDVVGAIRTNNQLISTVATGTSPLAVSSTTVVSNLNADMVDGFQGTDLAKRGGYSTTLTTPAGWYRIAHNGPVTAGGTGGDRATAMFTVRDTQSSRHSNTTFYASVNYGSSPTLTMLNRSFYSSNGCVKKIRIVEGNVYEGAAVEVYVDGTGANCSVSFTAYDNEQASGWTLDNWTAGSLPAGFAETDLNLDTTNPIMAATSNGNADAFYIGRTGNIHLSGAMDIGGTIANAAGNVVIGDTVDLGSATTGLRIDTNGVLSDIDGNIQMNDILQVNTIRDYSGGNLLLQDDAGNVGIGTTTPSSFKLEVAGNIGPDADNTRDIGSSARHYNTIYANNIVGVAALGYWSRTAGILSPYNANDGIAATSSATTVATFTSTGTNAAAQMGGAANYLTVASNGSLTFTNTGTATITGPATGLTIDAGLGTLGLGTSNNTKTINIGTGTGTDTINIGTGTTGPDVITIGSANAGNVTVRSNSILSLTGSTNSIIDFPAFDVAATGQITSTYANAAALNLTGNGSGITFGGAASNANSITTSNNNHLNLATGTGNVGIGTTAPREKLDVAGSATISGNLTIAQGSAIRSAYGPLTFSYKSGLNAWQTGMTIDDITGYVGIGNSSPGSPLTVNKTWTDIAATSMTGNITSQANYTSNNSNQFRSLANYAYIGTTTGTAVTGTQSTYHGALYIDNTNAGTISNAYANYFYSGVDAGAAGSVNNMNVYNAGMFTAGANTTAFGTWRGYNVDAISAATLNGATIGTLVGVDVGALSGGTNNYAFRGQVASGTNNYNLYMSGTAANYIEGNVGIGSSNPSAFKLEVAGNIGPDADNTRDIGSSARHYNTIYANNIVGVDALGYWNRVAGILSPFALNDGLAATSSATTVATFTSTGTNAAARMGGNSAYLTVASNGNLSFTNSSTATITGPTAGLTIDATTGTLGFGTSNNNRTINIGTGTGIDTINIGTGATGVDVIRLGSATADMALTDANWSITTAGAFAGITGNFSTSVTTPLLTNAGNLDISATGANAIDFMTNGSTRWTVASNGVFQSTGAQTIQTSTGNLTLATAGGNGHILLSPNGTGNVGIGSASPAQKLDVAGNIQATNGYLTNAMNTSFSNMVRNGSAENGTAYWAVSNDVGSDGAISAYASDSYIGSASLRYTRTAIAGWGSFWYNNLYNYLPSPYFDTNKTYTLSFWAKSLSGTPTLSTSIKDQSAANIVTSCSNTVLSGSWQQVTCTFTPAITGNTPVLYFSSSLTPSDILIDGVELTTGSQAYGYTAIQTDKKDNSYINGALSFGTNPALSGAVRLPNNTWITGRNAANNADVNMISINASNLVAFGANTAAFTLGGTISGNNQAISSIGNISANSSSNTITGFGTIGTAGTTAFTGTTGTFSTSVTSPSYTATGALSIATTGTNDITIDARGTGTGGSVLPGGTNLDNLGSPTNTWNTIYVNNIVGTGALGYWVRNAGMLSPNTAGDGLAATSSATTVATFTATGTNSALRAGGNTAYASVDASGNLTFTNSSTATITGPTAGLTIDATTGTLGFGTSNNNRTINIGTGTGIDTINMGTGATGADVINIGSANAGNVTVRSNAALSLTGSTNSIIDFPSFDVATTGQTTIAYANSAALNLSGNAAGITFGGTGTNQIITGGTNHLALMPGGNVGVGTTSPTAKLHVNGDLRVSNNSLYIDSTGVLSTTAANTPGKAFSNTSTTNLVTNGEFESWTAGTSSLPDGWTRTGATVSAREGTVVQSGNYSGKFTSNNTYSYINQYIPARGISTATRTYTVSFWYNSPATNTISKNFAVYDGVSYIVGGSPLTSDGAWHQFTYTFAARDDRTIGLVWWLTTGVADNDDVLYLDNVSLYEGTMYYASNERPIGRTGNETHFGELYNIGGNVGIGTTAPSSFALEVAGNIGPDADNTRNLGSSTRYFNTIYVNNIVGTGALGYWARTAGILSPVTANDGIAATSSATTVATFTSTGTNSSLRAGGNSNYMTVASNGSIAFTNATGSTIDSSGSLTIGGTNATGVTLGRSGQSTTLGGNVQAFTLAGNINGSGTPNITGIGQFSGSTGVFSTSVTSPLLTNAGNLDISATGANAIDFMTNGSTRWTVASNGVFQSTGAQTIQTSTGNLTLATAGGNGHILLSPNGTGNVGIGTTAPGANLQIGSTVSTANTIVRALAADAYNAGFEAYGNSQGTGYMYVGQAGDYGGGIFYNGDGTPSFATGEGSDRISFYRRNSNVNDVVFSYAYNSNDVAFRGNITAGTGTFGTNALINGGGTSYFNGGNVGIGTTTAANFNLEVAGNIGPDANGTRDLGSTTRYFNNLYVNNIYGAGSLGYWTRSAGALSPSTANDVIAATSSATTVATFTSSSTNDALRAGGSANYLTVASNGTLTFAGSAATINKTSGTLNINTVNNQPITTGNGLITLAGNVDATSGLDVTGASLTVGGTNASIATSGNITTVGTIQSTAEQNNLLVGCNTTACWTDANGVIGFYGSGTMHGQIAFYPGSGLAFINASSATPGQDYGPLTGTTKLNIYAGRVYTGGSTYYIDAATSSLNGLNLAGNLQVNGNTTLGDAATDTSTLRGLVTLTDSSSTYPLRFGADVDLYRGAASRLDLATGDSFNIVSGDFTQASAATTGSAHSITANALTSGNGMYITSSSITSGYLARLNQTTSTYTGTALYMNMANGSGTFTGNFMDLRLNGTSLFSVNYRGGVTGSYTTAVAGESTNLHNLTYTNSYQTAYNYNDLTLNSNSATIVQATTGGVDETMDNNFEGFQFNSGSYNGLGSVRVQLKKNTITAYGVSSYLRARLYADNAGAPSGTVLSTSANNIYVNTIGTTYGNYDFNFNYNLTPGTVYWVLIEKVNFTSNDVVFNTTNTGVNEWAVSAAAGGPFTVETGKKGYYYVYTRSSRGLFASSMNAEGVYGNSGVGVGVRGASISNSGVYGTSTYGYGGYFSSGTGLYNSINNSDTNAIYNFTQYQRTGNRYLDQAYNTWFNGTGLNLNYGPPYTNYYYVYDGAAYTDQTNALANQGGSAITILPNASSAFYFGRNSSTTSYRNFYFDFSNTPNVSGVVWEYATGRDGTTGDCNAWTAYTPSFDETNNLSRDGMVTLTGGGLTQCKVNGTDQYWFRVRATTVTTAPQAYAANFGMFSGYFARMYGSQANEKFRIYSNGSTYAAGYIYPGTGAETAVIQGSRGMYDTGSAVGFNTNLYLTGTSITSSGAVSLATGSNGNLTLAPNGSGDVIINPDADTNVQINATGVPTSDMVAITNAGQPVTSAGVNNLYLNFVGGAAAVESSAQRIDLTPGGTTGGIWSGLRLVGSAASSGVNENALKIDNLTAGAGTEYAVNIGTGWDYGIYSATSGNNYFAGNVGIGSASPAYKLDVQGWASASGNLTTGGQFQLGRFASNPTPTLGAGSMYFNSTDSSVYYYDGAIWTQIAAGGTSYWGRDNGVLTPLYTGDVIAATSGATTVSTFTQLDPTKLALRTGGNSDLTTLNVFGNGNIGIGTITPTGKLTIAGNITGPGNGITANVDTGRNMTPWDQTFEENITGWSTINNTSFTRSSAEAYDGTYSFRIKRNDLTGGGGASYVIGSTMKAGRVYTLSGYYKMVNGSGTAAVKLNSNGPNPYTNGTTYTDKTLSNATNWTFFSMSITASATVIGNDNYVWIGSNMPDTTQELYFDNLVLTDGSLPQSTYANMRTTSNGLSTVFGGNVGINNANPLERLDVIGNASASGHLTVGNGAWVRSAYGPLSLAYKNGINSWATGITLQDTTGNVGIGTTNPNGYKLNVNGTLFAGGNINLNNNNMTNISYLDIRNVDGYGIRFWGSDSYKIHMGNAAENHYGPVTDYSIKMNMSNTAGRGWVWGVAGATPVTAIEATTGNFQTAGNLTALGTTGITLQGNGAGLAFTGTGPNQITTAAGVNLGLMPGGNVGVGTTTANQKLAVTDTMAVTNTSGAQYLLMGNQDLGGTNKPSIIQAQNGDLNFGYGSSWIGNGGTMTTNVTFASGGNVGIGSTNPGQGKLVVAGGAIYSNVSGNNKIIDFAGGPYLSSVSPGTSNDLVFRNMKQLRFGDSTTYDWNAWAGIGYDSTNHLLHIGGASDAWFSNNTNPPPVTTVFNSGSVAIGTTTPLGLFHVNGGYGGNASTVINQTLGGPIFTASSSGTPRFTIANNGNVGIGVGYANPTNPLQVLSTSVPQLRLSYNTSEYATLGVASSGTTTLTTPNGASNTLVLVSGVNAGATSNPAIALKSNQSLNSNDTLFQLQNNDHFLATVMGNGQTWIGSTTTGPGFSTLGETLYIDGDFRAAKFYDKINDNAWVDPGNTSRMGSIQILDSNTLSFLDSSNVGIGTIAMNGSSVRIGNNVTDSLTDVDLCVGSDNTCAGKVDAGTVDPPYTINGKKYATYLPSMTGVKEETTGVLQATQAQKTGEGYAYVIDFDNQPEASDLWLFAKATNVKNRMNKMSVLLTPSDDVKTWYKTDADHHALIVYSSRPSSISFRLTAPRFDDNGFTNTRPDDAAGGFLINDPDVITEPYTLTDSGSILEALRIGTPAAADSSSDTLRSLSYTLRNINTGALIEESTSYAQAMIARIQAGYVESSNLVITNIANVKDAVIASLTAATARIDEAFIARLTVNEKIVSPVVETNEVKTDLIAPKKDVLTLDLSSPATSSGDFAKLVIKGINNNAVVSIDAEGNATFAGSLAARDASISGSLVASEATISGSLVAREVHADNIDRLASDSAAFSDNLASQAGSLAQLNTNSLQLSSDINAVQQELAALKNQPLPQAQYYQTLSSTAAATVSALLAQSVNTDSLMVTGNANLFKASIADSLTVGNILVQNDSILSLSWNLNLAALNQVTFFDNAVTIAKNGTITAKGEVVAEGGVKTDTIKATAPENNVAVDLNAGKKLEITAAGQEVASIDASGSAKFNSIAFNEIATNSAVIADSGKRTSNNEIIPALQTNAEAAGTGSLPANAPEIIIYNSKVTKDSLIYLTPTGDTHGFQLTVVKKESCTDNQTAPVCTPYFSVSTSAALHPAVDFNWLIIN